MEGDTDIRLLSLNRLPSSTRQILSDLLNSTKVIPTDGPEKLPRDWRGLASQAQLTSETEASIQKSSDSTARVLYLWTQNSSPNVGHLLAALEKLDRYDAYDDVCNDLKEEFKKGKLAIVNQNVAEKTSSSINSYVDNRLTCDDGIDYSHIYDAYVLYAEDDERDKQFVNEMINRLTAVGLKICTRDKLLPGLPELSTATRVITERCLRIILVYSPEFLNSPANTFFSDYTHSYAVETRLNKALPIMFRQCTLPGHLNIYHNLRYDGNMLYDFWQKLIATMISSRAPNGINSIQKSLSSVNIAELQPSDDLFLPQADDMPTALHEAKFSASDGNIAKQRSQDSSSVSSGSREKKKTNLLKSAYKRIEKALGGKKCKKEVMQAA